MKVFDPVSLVLRKKGTDIWSVPPDTTVYSAMKMMADKDVGALLVMDGEQLVGMVSERDYARKVILMGRSSKDTLVREILSEPLITIRPGCSVDEAMRLITTHRIRDLPCERSRVTSASETYLKDFVKNNTTIDALDVYQVMRAAGQVEVMLSLSRTSRFIESTAGP
jgi:predicted transcriptional regulator